MADDRIRTVDDLRRIYPEPKGRPVEKQLAALEEHSRRFIELSPFLVLATAGDASPKGDPPGFVKVIDDKTILIPDRRGNNRLDSMQNVLDNPNVGVLFFVPGLNETLRVNGRAEITDDATLLEPLAVNGKAPKTGTIVHIEEVYMHCAKALVRSKLWDPERHIDRTDFPPIGQVFADHIGGGSDPEEIERHYAKHNEETLY